MLSAPNDDKPDPEHGYRKPRTSLPEPSPAYQAGTQAASYLLNILGGGGVALNGALHQALHEVVQHGQPDMLRGFTDALQERLGPRS